MKQVGRTLLAASFSFSEQKTRNEHHPHASFKNQSTMLGCNGPMERLRLGGIWCACMESDDHVYYRLADMALRSVPIRWLRRLGHYNSPTDGAVQGQVDSSDATKPPNAIINATLDVVDTAAGPAIRVISNQFVFADEDDGDVRAISDNIVISKTILLKNITSTSGGTFDDWARMGLLSGEGRIMSTGVMIKFKDGSKERTLSFEVKSQSGVKHGLTRDDVVKHINALVDFERNRLGLTPLKKDEREESEVPKGGSNELETREGNAIIPVERTMSLNEKW